MLTKLLSILSVVTISISSVIIPKADESLFRLPSNVKPSYYDLKIRIDVEELKFVGDVSIDIEVFDETESIPINYKDIEVAWQDVVLVNRNSPTGLYEFQLMEPQVDYEIALIRFVNKIQPGFYSMTLSFTGNFRNDLIGLYKITYDKDKVIATTQFAPSFARMVFPCYDEPHLKAKFKITILHDRKFTALSNMRMATTHTDIADDSEFITTTFEESPLMPTYLVAFIVSDYERYGEVTDFYVGYAAPGQAADTNDSIQFAPKAMKALETFLGVDYQLPFTQFVAINDLVSGDMGNLGLITIESKYLLYPNWYVSPQIHQQGRLQISHKLADMWFGNVVTPEWWTYIWLSKGFAQFFQYYISDEIEPSWRIWEQFTVNNLQSALSQDDKNNIRRMSEPVLQASATQFDYIVSAKASSVVRMFYEIIGKEAFKSALNIYLTNNLIVVPKNLFDSFQTAIDTADIILPTSFAILFESWSNELGYPVVNADVQTQTSKIVVSQKRFFIDPDLMANSVRGNYYIPITVATDKNEDSYGVDWLSPDLAAITINFDTNDKFTVLNKLQAGYYRVNYNLDHWKYLADFLSNEANTLLMREENRAQLIDDAANLAKAGLVKYEILLKLLHNLQHDTGLLPWMAANNAIKFLERMLLGSKQYGRFENFLRIITNKSYETHKFDVAYEEHVERLQRINSVAWACQYGNEQCVKDAINFVRTFVIAGNPRFADEIMPFVFCTFSRNTKLLDDVTTQLLVKVFIDFRDSSNVATHGQLNNILDGLGCTKEVIETEVLLTLSNEVRDIPDSENRARIAVGLVNGNYKGVEIMVQLLANHFITIRPIYEDNGIVSLLNALGPRIVTENVANLFDDFVNTFKAELQTVPAMYDAATRAQEMATENVKWRQTYGDEIELWLQNNIDDLDGDPESTTDETENTTDGGDTTTDSTTTDEPSISSVFVLSKIILFIATAAMLCHLI